MLPAFFVGSSDLVRLPAAPCCNGFETVPQARARAQSAKRLAGADSGGEDGGCAGEDYLSLDAEQGYIMPEDNTNVVRPNDGYAAGWLGSTPANAG